MASLSTQNPHVAAPPCCSHHTSTADVFAACRGSPISQGSKLEFAINFQDTIFPLADVRSLLGAENKDGYVDLELFFDGEVDQLGSEPGNFSKSVAEKISQRYREERVEELRKILQNGNEGEMAKFKSRKMPDLEISQIGTNEEAFRDAGCMLRFLAVRLRLNIEAAQFLGRRCFPESFGGEAEIDDRPYPQWLNLVAVSAGILLLAVVYAWGQILRKAVDGY